MAEKPRQLAVSSIVLGHIVTDVLVPQPRTPTADAALERYKRVTAQAKAEGRRRTYEELFGDD